MIDRDVILDLGLDPGPDTMDHSLSLVLSCSLIFEDLLPVAFSSILYGISKDAGGILNDVLGSPLAVLRLY